MHIWIQTGPYANKFDFLQAPNQGSRKSGILSSPSDFLSELICMKFIKFTTKIMFFNPDWNSHAKCDDL